VSDAGGTAVGWLSLRRADAAIFGGKSASLGELIAAGIPVPPGFALSTTGFGAFVEEAGLAGRISLAVADLAPEDLDRVNAVSSAISEGMRSAPVPESVRAEVARRYAELSADADPPVAVRSSALGEDSQDATFAGQQETYLWVRGADGVCDAVRDCWVSLYSPQAMTYRARLGAGGAAPAMGVTVQLMVDAEVSGVMFTCNPVSGDPSMVAVNASWGLGLAVVGGEVTPDDYLVSKVTGEVVRQTVTVKEIEYVPGAHGRGAVRAEVRPSGAGRPASTSSGWLRWWRSRAGWNATSAAPGHRMGDRARRGAVRGPVAPGDRRRKAHRPAQAADGDLAGDEQVRRRERRERAGLVLSDDDVREILRLIDESELDELRIETEGFSLHVLRGGAGSSIRAPEDEQAAREPAVIAPHAPKRTGSRSRHRCSESSTGLRRPVPRRSSRSGRASSPTPSSA